MSEGEQIWSKEIRQRSTYHMQLCSAQLVLRALELQLQRAVLIGMWHTGKSHQGHEQFFLCVRLPSGNNHVSHSKCKASGLLHMHRCGLRLLWYCMSVFLVSHWSIAKHSGVSVFKNKANQIKIWTQAYASFWVGVQVDTYAFQWCSHSLCFAWCCEAARLIQCFYNQYFSVLLWHCQSL